MLLNDYIHPTLLISADSEAQGGTLAAMTSSAIIKSAKSLAEEKMNDVLPSNISETALDCFNVIQRIPIILYDGLVPVNVHGYGSTTSKVITNIDGVPQVSDGANDVSVTLKIKNSLTGISAIADTITAICSMLGDTKLNNNSTTVKDIKGIRASFFSPTMVVNDGYLVGIYRETVADSDVELVSLTIQRNTPAPKSTKRDILPKKPETAASPELVTNVKKPSNPAKAVANG